MAKINEIKEQQIKDSARIMDILEDGLGVQLQRDGANYQGLCPFHEDKHLGSFKVSESKNICTCFSCGKSWNPIDALLSGNVVKNYGEALRWIAAKYNIYIDDEPVPVVKQSAPRPKPQELPMIYWPCLIAKASIHNNEPNNLIKYLDTVPFSKEDKDRLDIMKRLYAVGTSQNGWTKGYTIWWQIDDQRRVRTGKLMAYNEKGHREKKKTPSFTWIHSLLEQAKQYDKTKYQIKTCLFGLHLIDAFPDAEICIVESEKSALICSAFTDPNKRLWMATAGKSGLSREKLKPLIERNRYIVIYPDKDGYDEWRAIADMIGYNRISVSNKVNQLWISSDGDKADIADIMLRRQSGIIETDADKIIRRLGIKDKTKEIEYMIKKLDLQLID